MRGWSFLAIQKMRSLVGKILLRLVSGVAESVEDFRLIDCIVLYWTIYLYHMVAFVVVCDRRI